MAVIGASISALKDAVPEPDAGQMRQHLEHLFGGDLDGCHEGKIEIAWTDATDHKLKHAAIFGTDELDELVERAVKENRVPGQNVYIGQALRKPGILPFGRCNDNDFFSLTAYYADIDDDVTAAATVFCRDRGCPPTAVVVTGRHPHVRAQMMWRQETPERDPEACRRQNKALADALGGDPSVVNPSRVMRLGGSIAWSTKPGRIIERTEFLTFDDDRPKVYFPGQLAKAFPPNAIGATPTTEPVAVLHIGSEFEGVNADDLIAAVRAGDQWHNNMLRLTGHWIARDWSDAEIMTAAETLTLPGYLVEQTRDEVAKMIAGGRAKGYSPNRIDLDDWPDPVPLTTQVDEPDEYPLQALPSPLLRAAIEVSRFAMVPVASPAVIGLSVAATAIGRRAIIEERPGLHHNLALFHVLIAASGERKSPAFKYMTSSLGEWEKDQEPHWQKQTQAIQASNAVTERIIAKLEKGSVKDIQDVDRDALVQQIAAEKARVRKLPPTPRLFTTDPTEERLFQLMHDRDGVFAVLSGEGRQIIDNLMGRRSGDGYMGDAIYLAGITGDTITRDRVGASQTGPESRVIREPMLNVAIMIQPDKYMDAARHPRLRASGALARIWPVRLPSLIGQRIEAPDEVGLDAAEIAPFNGLMRLILVHEVRRDDNNRPVPHIISLGADAAKARRDWHNVIERMMADGGGLDDVRDIASKAVSATVKAAGIIHILQHPDYLAASGSELPLVTWQQAQFLGEYHLHEAIRIQRAAGEDQRLEPARKVLRWLAQHAIGSFKVRDLQRNGPRPRLDAVQLERVCAVLTEFGWLKKLSDATDYVVHPSVAGVAIVANGASDPFDI